MSNAKISVKDIDETFNNFLESLEGAEKKTKEILEMTEEEAGRLVAEAAADAKELERNAQKYVDEARRIVEEKLKLAIEDMRKEGEKQIEELLKKAQVTFEENFESAVEVLLNALFG